MLSTKVKPTIDYDSQYDVLYYTIGDTSNSYGDEDPTNIITLRDFETEEITGYTIMNFRKICNKRSSEYDILQKMLDLQSIKSECGF